MGLDSRANHGFCSVQIMVRDVALVDDLCGSGRWSAMARDLEEQHRKLERCLEMRACRFPYHHESTYPGLCKRGKFRRNLKKGKV